ncbi:MAG: D-xylose ABC transporter ATP-binding protein [Anaerolinea sp.]|nr:D-xylose ABC transporter ATP-binding protein [Anaerolinea sp.]
MADQTYRLELKNITKSFPGVLAVQDVTLHAYVGEILALVGENGAGKSTLMNILSGAFSADCGTILLDGQEVKITSPRRAQELGIAMIHQELALIPQMTVAQNIFLGREPLFAAGTLVNIKKMMDDAQDILNQLGLDFAVNALISDLSIAQRQMVEIAKAISTKSRVIILDEPTSALSERESGKLFNLMRSLREQGVTLIYISHRMEEIFALSDRVAVMRDGQLVGVAPTKELTVGTIVQMMVGRELKDFFPKTETQRGCVTLEVQNLRSGARLKDASFTLYKGEIVGLAGLVGSGRTEIARVLFGADKNEGGEIRVDGQSVKIHSPQEAIRHGIGLVTEDRKVQGLFLGQSVRSNASVSLFQRLSRLGFLLYGKIDQWTRGAIQQLNIRASNLEQRAGNLSGGNQQKVVIARWLAVNPKILILDEPTRGIDVSSKAEIHSLISELAAKGVAILMISSELPEILGISDRILVMREGQLTAEFSRAEATQGRIMQAATGQLQNEGLNGS